MLAVMLSVLASYGQSSSQTTSSAEDSPKSDIRATSKSYGFSRETTPEPGAAVLTRKRVTPTEACAAAVDELKASRVLIDALESENTALRSRLETEKRATQLLEELNATRKSETDALRRALDAKNETIAAKDAVIASQDKLIETLKSKKQSPWKRVLDILVGVGVGAVVR